MKSASAYDRSLQYGEGDREAARSVFYKQPSQVNQEGRIAYEDFMFNWFCQLCAKFDVPSRFIPDWGNYRVLTQFSRASNPGYPEIYFVLFHAGYPWYDEMAGLLHNHSMSAWTCVVP